MCVTRPKGSLALRLTPSPSEAPTAGLLRKPLGQLHGERTSTMVSSFQLTRTVKLRLTHQRTRRDAEENAELDFLSSHLAPRTSHIALLNQSCPVRFVRTRYPTRGLTPAARHPFVSIALRTPHPALMCPGPLSPPRAGPAIFCWSFSQLAHRTFSASPVR